MKLCLLGAHGTGKSTLINHFRDKYNVIDGIARKCIKQGCSSSELGTYESQEQIFDSYLHALEKDDYISTRSVLDVLAYTAWLTRNKKIHFVQYASQLQRTVSWWIRNPEVIVCYVPIEFDIENDGTRSTDTGYQYEIDKEMKNVLEQFSIPYFTIAGTPKKRIKQLEEIIKDINTKGVDYHKIKN